MPEPRTFVLISPNMEGDDIKQFQRTLNTRFEAWNIDKRIPDDGAYGSDTRHAAQQVCEGLGILHEQAMRRGVTPELRSKIRNPQRRTEQERARSERRKEYRAKLRERYKGGAAGLAVAFARDHLGEREVTSNRSPQIDKWIRAAGHDPRMNLVPPGGVPWCGCFVNACIMAAGLPNGKTFNIAAVQRIVERARGEVDRWQLVDPSKGRPGDLACWQSKPFTTMNPWAHVEIVEKRVSGTTYVCIGGNTSQDGAGNPSEGGGVFRNTRTTAPAGGRITVFARPPYDV
jgi:hypothetical protein